LVPLGEALDLLGQLAKNPLEGRHVVSLVFLQRRSWLCNDAETPTLREVSFLRVVWTLCGLRSASCLFIASRNRRNYGTQVLRPPTFGDISGGRSGSAGGR